MILPKDDDDIVIYHWGGKEDAVEAIHDAAVSWYQIAVIFDAHLPLICRGSQISALGEYRADQTDDDTVHPDSRNDKISEQSTADQTAQGAAHLPLPSMIMATWVGILFLSIIYPS